MAERSAIKNTQPAISEEGPMRIYRPITSKPEQHNAHVLKWLFFMTERLRQGRRQNLWYRGKVTRMTQLNQLRARGDKAGYVWLKELWRRELNAN